MSVFAGKKVNDHAVGAELEKVEVRRIKQCYAYFRCHPFCAFFSEVSSLLCMQTVYSFVGTQSSGISWLQAFCARIPFVL